MVLLALMNQGCRAVLGLPSYQIALGNLGLLFLPFYQGNLVVDRWMMGQMMDDEKDKKREKFSQRQIIIYIFNGNVGKNYRKKCSNRK